MHKSERCTCSTSQLDAKFFVHTAQLEASGIEERSSGSSSAHSDPTWPALPTTGSTFSKQFFPRQFLAALLNMSIVAYFLEIPAWAGGKAMKSRGWGLAPAACSLWKNTP